MNKKEITFKVLEKNNIKFHKLYGKIFSIMV